MAASSVHQHMIEGPIFGFQRTRKKFSDSMAARNSKGGNARPSREHRHSSQTNSLQKMSNPLRFPAVHCLTRTIVCTIAGRSVPQHRKTMYCYTPMDIHRYQVGNTRMSLQGSHCRVP